MERPATPILRAKLIGADDDLTNAIGQALAADGARLVDHHAADDSGAIDILVFVAPDRVTDPIATTKAADFADHVGATLRAAFLALQRGVSSVRVGGRGGAVVLVAPPAGGRRAFDTVTQGLRLMAKAAALELGPERIRVNIVLPGSGENPLGRPCAPADVARAVAFAASGRSRFMTGADVVVDGGALAL